MTGSRSFPNRLETRRTINTMLSRNPNLTIINRGRYLSTDWKLCPTTLATPSSVGVDFWYKNRSFGRSKHFGLRRYTCAPVTDAPKQGRKVAEIEVSAESLLKHRIGRGEERLKRGLQVMVMWFPLLLHGTFSMCRSTMLVVGIDWP
jgi:hypothetical protein